MSSHQNFNNRSYGTGFHSRVGNGGNFWHHSQTRWTALNQFPFAVDKQLIHAHFNGGASSLASSGVHGKPGVQFS